MVTSLLHPCEEKQSFKADVWKDQEKQSSYFSPIHRPRRSSVDVGGREGLREKSVYKGKTSEATSKNDMQSIAVPCSADKKQTDVFLKKSKTKQHHEMRLYHLIESCPYPLMSILSRGRYYQPLREIGTGSFGKALLVKDLRADEGQNKQYVMKIIDTARLGPKERADAVNEVQLLASLRHPYIISYKESFVEKCYLCIVMDYADGGDLFRAITQHRLRGERFSESQILRWFTQAALALKYLHEKHILHRDLKSQNLFLMAKGRLRLGDFGIAKALDCTSAFTKTQIGTPYYLSPEICKNQPYSWASDIWALGCILYELATLRVPFTAPNITALLNKITSQAAPQLPDCYSVGLRQLCRDCLQREWRRRPSASALLKREITQNEIRAMLLEEQKKRQRHPVHPVSSGGVLEEKTAQPPTHGVTSWSDARKPYGINGETPVDKKNYQQFSILGDVELPAVPRLTCHPGGEGKCAHACWSQSTSPSTSSSTRAAGESCEHALIDKACGKGVEPPADSPPRVKFVEGPDKKHREPCLSSLPNEHHERKKLSGSVSDKTKDHGENKPLATKSKTDCALRPKIVPKEIASSTTGSSGKFPPVEKNSTMLPRGHPESRRPPVCLASRRSCLCSPLMSSPLPIHKSLFSLNVKKPPHGLRWEHIHCPLSPPPPPRHRTPPSHQA